MKKCSECNIEMINGGNLHTDYVGGVSFETQIFLDYEDEEKGSKMLFGNKKYSKKRIMARVCPKCGKVELNINLDE